ncbi:hypothetical protein M1843_04095 [Isoptericola sp. 4D.3]|uniref:Uncharacterized protein n=1 Tax=Isoptericola peretonis TaxID=2918523 RepID=A0ABT0J0D2_9MICO|nr:hypothetical protein [Isoptericola sp. 4D.3]
MSGVWRRPTSLAAAGALSLAAGLGAGFASGLVTGPAVSATAGLPSGPPDECAVVQAAWSRSASLQIGMSVDEPDTLRRGFLGARDALAEVRPPDAVLDDWQTVTTYVGTVADTIEEADQGEVASAVASALAELDTGAMTAASDRVTTFLKAGCSTDPVATEGAPEDASDGADEEAGEESGEDTGEGAAEDEPAG